MNILLRFLYQCTSCFYFPHASHMPYTVLPGFPYCNNNRMTGKVKWKLITSSSPQKTRFNTMVLYMAYVIGKVVLAQVSPSALQFCPAIYHSTDDTHLCIAWSQHNSPQYQGTWSHCTAMSGTTIHITEGLWLATLLKLVQLSTLPRDSVSLHCHKWYNSPHYQGTLAHHTSTAGTIVLITKV